MTGKSFRILTLETDLQPLQISDHMTKCIHQVTKAFPARFRQINVDEFSLDMSESFFFHGIGHSWHVLSVCCLMSRFRIVLLWNCNAWLYEYKFYKDLY